MATRTGDVAGTVHEVIAAFDKAVNLVRRIEDRKDGKNDPEAVRDLFKSLSLGPVIVQGYFDADSKRFGASYLIGDYQAQVELRDILLGLKNLVGDLQDVLLDDSPIDFRQLQETSDGCRSNAGVCLGQLSQRLAQARDPMNSHLQNPPPQYMSGVPPFSSPGLHYSSSRSTHSSSGGRSMMAKTPDPFVQKHTLSPQWQAKRFEPEENYHQHFRKQDAEASLHDSNGNWSQSSQLFTERDADELSVRRPSSHTLAPEDGALLSPTLSSNGGQRPPLLPGQQDLARDSYTSFNLSNGSQSPIRQSATSPVIGRERFGPDDFSPTEQHGPFRIDRDSNQSATAYASRAYDNHHSTLEHIAEPQPLRLPHRPVRQPSHSPRGPPPRKPIPPVPYEALTGHAPVDNSADAPVPIPTHMYGQKVPIPPRSQSRSTPDGNGIPQRLQSLHTGGPPFQPSPQVQRAIQSDQLRRQYGAERSQEYMAQPSSQPQSNVYPHGLGKSPSSANVRTPPQPPYPIAQREQIVLSPQSPQPLQPPSLSVFTQSQSRPTTSSASHPPSNQSTASIPIPQNLPLALPTDKNTHPFCKGAFRLFIGLPKKAFNPAQKPVGFSSFVSYWRCDKCLFEGPMREVPGPPDKKGRPGKPEKVFDATIRECGAMSTAIIGPDGRGEGSGGIRYKWSFLAKSHVPLKTVPEGKPDGSFGGYGCMFCAAEGQARGWISITPGMSDAASIMSGKSGNSSNSAPAGNTPVFGNLQLFMDHLQMHRLEVNWPCPEMRMRMKCIVGRIADRNEDWEVNFLPH